MAPDRRASASAYSAAAAAENQRAAAVSARLVRITGARAPTTSPAGLRVGHEGEVFIDHVAGLDIRRDQDIGEARDR